MKINMLQYFVLLLHAPHSLHAVHRATHLSGALQKNNISYLWYYNPGKFSVHVFQSQSTPFWLAKHCEYIQALSRPVNFSDLSVMYHT